MVQRKGSGLVSFVAPQSQQNVATHEVETLDHDEFALDSSTRSPMDSSLKDEPINMFDDDQADLAPHPRNRPNPRDRTIGDESVADLGFEPMHTEN